MGVRQRLALAGLAALVLGACTPHAQEPARGGQSFAVDMSAADRATCTASGGTVQRLGRIQAEQCIHTFVDAGKQCTDSAQCQGKCVTSASDAAPGASVTGQCQANDRLFGCYAEVKGGKPVNAICVD